MTSRVLRIRATDQVIFDHLKSGRKSVETRAATDRLTDLKTGDSLEFVCDDQSLTKTIASVRRFGSPRELFASFDYTKVFPEATSRDEAMLAFNRFPGYADKIREHGLVAFELS